MTLEVLFARSMQVQAFLLLTAAGVALGAAMHLAGWLHRRQRLLGMLADLLSAAGATAAAVYTALLTGSGLRLYGLLGLCTGAALYAWGVGPVIRKMADLAAKTFPAKAGMRGSRAESTVHGESAEG